MEKTSRKSLLAYLDKFCIKKKITRNKNLYALLVVQSNVWKPKFL